jgi:hypothetical protein
MKSGVGGGGIITLQDNAFYMLPALSKSRSVPCTGSCWTIPFIARTCHRVTFIHSAPSRKGQGLELWVGDSSENPEDSLRTGPTALSKRCLPHLPWGLCSQTLVISPEQFPKRFHLNRPHIYNPASDNRRRWQNNNTVDMKWRTGFVWL